MSRSRLGPRGLEYVRDNLSGRDYAIIRHVADLRLMSARHIERIHFTADEHASNATAARSSRRVLERLVRDRLLIRLDRRIGGVRAGSASFIYAIGPVGERLQNTTRPRRRFREPSTTFALHTLAITDTVVTITEAARSGHFDLLQLQPEPHCWRTLPGIPTSILRPDLFVSVGIGDFEHRWFIEVDLGTEHLPTLIRKCHAYQTYFQSGSEQAEHGVFPRVLWTMHHPERAHRLAAAVAADHRLTTELFTVTTEPQLLTTLTGGSL